MIEVGILALAAAAGLSLKYRNEAGRSATKMEELELRLKGAGIQIDQLSREKNQLAEELAAFADLAQKLGSTALVKDTVDILVAMIRRFRIPHQSCVVLLYNHQGTLTPIHVDSRYTELLGASRLLRLEEPLIQRVLKSRKARVEPKITGNPEERIFKDEASAMAVPLLVSRELIGVIYLGSVKEGTHTAEHLKTLKTLSELAAPSLKNAKLLEAKEQDLASERETREAVEAKNSQLAGLQQLGQRIGRTLSSLDTVTVVAESLQEMIPQAQSVILFTPAGLSDSHALRAECAHTPYAEYVRNLAPRDDDGLFGTAHTLGKTMLVPDTEIFRVENILASENSVVIAPLLSQADSGESPQSLGFLYVGAVEKNSLNEEHRNLVETVSYQAAMALKNARLYEQTQRLALTDGLTGLCTHRLFQEKLAEEIVRAKKQGQSLVLAMVDADNFKTYNDTLGHPAGDALLQDIANLLRDKVRPCDLVCRYGGDEFALLLRDIDKEAARTICERIREAFQLRFGGNKVQVTSSIGIACYPIDAGTKKDLAKAADDALYQSKRGGRNRVSVSASKEIRHARPLVHEVLAR